MKEFGHLSYFLGLEITYSTDGFHPSKFLFRAGLIDSKTVNTPIELNAYSTPLAEETIV